MLVNILVATSALTRGLSGGLSGALTRSLSGALTRGLSGALTRGLSGDITGSARLEIGSAADKSRDNGERGHKIEERAMSLLSHRNGPLL